MGINCGDGYILFYRVILYCNIYTLAHLCRSSVFSHAVHWLPVRQRVQFKVATLVNYNRPCLGTLSATWLTIAASSPTPVQQDCARLTLVRFSSVGRAPTWATEPSVQLDLESGTICRRTSDTGLSYSRLRLLLKTFWFGLWDQSAV